MKQISEVLDKITVDQSIPMERDTELMRFFNSCSECGCQSGAGGRVEYNVFYRRNLCSSCDRSLTLTLRQQHPEYFLKYCGVPKRYLTCSLDNFECQNDLVSRFRNYLKLKPLISLMVFGTCGNGKTHLAVAILRELVRMNVPIQNFEFVSSVELLNEIKSCYDKQSSEAEATIINRYTSKKLLVLDDFGYDEQPTNWQINLMFLIIDRIIRNNQIMIITTNNSLTDIDKKFGTRIADRLSEIKQLEIRMDSYRKRRWRNAK